MVVSHNDRQTKAKELLSQNKVKKIRDDFYRVRSQNTSETYGVVKLGRKWACSCPDAQFRNTKCKHVYAVEALAPIPVQQKITTSILRLHQDGCIYCDSKNTKKDGVRKNKRGPTQIYHCNDCHKYFTLNPGFEKMKSKPELITFTMHLYFFGLSLRNVSESIKQLGFEVTHQTIYNWIKKYVTLMDKYMAQFVPQVSDTWRADELYIKIRGDRRFIFAVIDDETRYWIAKQVADYKYSADARPLFREAKEIAQKRPAVIITDGGKSFHYAHLREFFTMAGPRTKHLSHAHVRGDYDNNKMERFNGELRDREKVMRGLKVKSTPIIPGYQIFHNHIRSHMGLSGKTPGEECGIKIEGQNKWITLIQNASQKQMRLSDYG